MIAAYGQLAAEGDLIPPRGIVAGYSPPAEQAYPAALDALCATLAPDRSWLAGPGTLQWASWPNRGPAG
jgi:hypothetical protein